MDWHLLHSFFFFNLIFLSRHSDGQSIIWDGHTIFDDVASNNNTWTTGLPQLKFEFSSNGFNYSRTGFFDFDFKFKNGSIIKTCPYKIQLNVCSADCTGSGFSCTGTPSSGLLVTLEITNLSEDLDESFVILTQSTVVPVTTDDDWNVDQLKIGVQNCTEKTPIEPSSNFSQPSVSCDYLCSTSLVCADGYIDGDGKNDLIATCQANNTWEENGTPCKPITCKITECTGCCNQNSASDQLQYGEQLNVSCCYNISDTSQYVCLDGSPSPSITCPDPTTSIPLTTVMQSSAVPVTTATQSSASSSVATDLTSISSEEPNLTTHPSTSIESLETAVTTTKTSTTSKTSSSSKTSTTSTPSPVTIPSNNTRVCIGGCLVTSSSNGNYEVTCLDQRYNKKSLSATKNSDGVFTTEVALYCIGYTGGYIAGITISVIGGLAIVVNAIIVGVAWCTADDKNKILPALGLGIASTVVWAVCIGLLFGLEEGNYDMNGGQITGCVLGSFACVGAIGSCAWSGKVMKEGKS